MTTNQTSHAPPDRRDYSLAKIIPPRVGEKTLSATENLISAVSSEDDVLSFEMVGTHNGVTLMHRAERDDALFRTMMTAHFPSAIVEAVPSDADPLMPGPDEDAWTCTLKVEGAPYLPLRIFSNLDVQADHGADPMAAVIGAHANFDAHERVVSRLILRPLAHDWSEPYKRLGLGGAGSHNAAQSIEEQRSKSTAPSKPSSSDDDGKNGLSVFGGLAIVGLVGFMVAKWFQGLPTNSQVGAGVVMALLFVASLIGAFFWWRSRTKPKLVDDYVNPTLAMSRINDLAYQIEINVTVLIKKDLGTENNARSRMRSIIQAFKHFDHPEGSRLVVDGDLRPHTGAEDFLEFTKPEEKKFGFLKKEEALGSVIGLHEVASMWHLPTKEDHSMALEKSYSYNLAPPREMKNLEGAYVGDSTIGPEQKIMFSPDMTRRHQFIIARTGMGKSTLIQHFVTHKLSQKALGLDNDAIVVVDPHSDLIQSLLEMMAPGLEKKVWLIDLSDEEHVPGINVLDAHVFPDRDHTCDGVVRVTKGIWDTWGSRMQNILEHTIKSLHEANSHPDTPREKQYTLLDGMRMLSEADFRAAVLEKVHDPFLLRYWREEFEKMRPQLRSEAIAPVQTRLAYFASSKRAREILGQRSSTLDIRKAIEDGDIIFVNTAQAIVGRDVAALVGASILNLVDAVIRRQGLKDEADRRGVYVVVDEMQTIPGVNFQGMLSEIRKVGGALCLVTQSLSALSDLGDTMRDVLLANMGCLVVFQVAAVDAQRLVWELGKESISEDDITSLPAHHAYVRVTVDGKRIPAFSMSLRYPQTGNPERAEAIRKLSSSYTLSAKIVEEKMAKEDYEERAAKDALVEAERIRSEASMDGGMVFTEVIEFSKEQQNGIESKARKSKRRNSRLHPNAVQTGGMSTKNVVGSTGKRGGTNGTNETEPMDDREITQNKFEDNR